MTDTPWWSAIPAATLSPIVHKRVSGIFTVNSDGLSWNGGRNAWFRLPWSAFRQIKVETIRTQRRRRRGAVGFGPLGVAVVAATALSNVGASKVAVAQRVTFIDGKQQVWVFETGLPRANVDAVFGPVLQALKVHEQKTVLKSALEAVEKPALNLQPTPLGVADELKKLADLHEAGVLTDEEFAAQKAKLLK